MGRLHPAVSWPLAWGLWVEGEWEGAESPFLGEGRAGVWEEVPLFSLPLIHLGCRVFQTFSFLNW